MSDQINMEGRDGLGQLLEGRSDDEISEFVNVAGIDTVLAQVFDGMKQAFVPEKAAGQSAVVQWDVTAPDGPHSWTVKIADGTCTATTGAADAPRLTRLVGYVAAHAPLARAVYAAVLRGGRGWLADPRSWSVRSGDPFRGGGDERDSGTVR